jgi:WD40 repeat protein/tRNA A-37 threonylcarbamoyl transferase component Bud32
MAAKTIVTNAELLEALRQSRLLGPPQLEELAGPLQQSFNEPRALAGELIQRGWLTPFQVNQIFQGGCQDLVLGRYVLLERLGEGGMGQVFKARHLGLDRVVALKVIRKQHLSNSEAIRRFRREIEAAAKLAHPNVVLAFDADEVEGNHFFAMEYVEGTDLGRLLKQSGRLPVADACEYARQAALGLQHAHECGMVHRDIKPGNLMLARSEKSAVVKIMDMGLARILDDGGSAQITQARKLVGTADYMAPEQAINSHKADIRSDLYSLGCTLYHLIAGTVPFPGSKMVEKLVQHQRDEPVPLEQLRPEVQPAVGAVVRKLMAKRAGDRYQTPAEAAQALAALNLPMAQFVVDPVAPDAVAVAIPQGPAIPAAVPLHAQAIAAAPAAIPLLDETPAAIPVGAVAVGATPMAVPWNGATTPRDLMPTAVPVKGPSRAGWPHRRWLLAGGAGLLAAGVLAFFVFRSGNDSRGRPTPEEPKALPGAAGALKSLQARFNRPQASSEDLRREILELRLRYPATAEAIEAGGLLTQLPSPLDRLQAKQIPKSEQFPQWQPTELVAVLGEHAYRHWGPVQCLAFSSNGRLLASGGEDRAIRLWDVGGALSARAVITGHVGAVTSLAFSPDGDVLVSGSRDNTVRLWDVSGPRPRELFVFKGHIGPVLAVAFAPDGKLLASGGQDGTIRLWHPAGDTAKQQVLKADDEGGPVNCVAFAPNSRVLASGGGDRTIRLWDLTAAVPRDRTVLREHTAAVNAVAYAPSGKLLASASADGTVKLWDLSGGLPQEIATPPSRGGWSVRAVAFSADSGTLAAVSNSGRVRLLEINDGAVLGASYLSPQGRSSVFAVAFGARRGLLATGGWDCAVRLWDLTAGKHGREQFFITGPLGPAYAVRFAADGQTLVCAHGDATVRQWDLSQPQPKERPAVRSDGNPIIRSMALSPNGKMLAFTSGNRTLQLWDLSGAQPKPRPELRLASGDTFQAVAISPDGKLLATGSSDRIVRLWSLTSGTDPKERSQLKQAGSTLAFSPDGKLLAAGSQDGRIHLWDISGLDPRPRPVTPVHTNAVNGLAFSPDGKMLATASNDGTTCLFDLSRGEPRQHGQALRHRLSTVNAVAFAPDGKSLATVTSAGRLVRWNVNGRELRQWEMPGAVIHDLSYSPDGRHLAVANGNGTVYILRLAQPPVRTIVE